MITRVFKKKYNQVGQLNLRFFSKPRNIFSFGIYIFALFFLQSLFPFANLKEAGSFQFNSNLNLEKQIILTSTAPFAIHSFLLESMDVDEDEEEKFFCSIRFCSFLKIIIDQLYSLISAFHPCCYILFPLVLLRIPFISFKFYFKRATH